jgi:hypothetical protein
MTEETSRPWLFGLSCRSCGRRLETTLVDPSSGDNVIPFVEPGTLYLLCRRCGVGSDYPRTDLTSRPAGEDVTTAD